MASPRRLNVTLDPEHAERLSALAKRTHVQEGTLARSLLASALDRADPDPTQITALLDGIPGALDRALESRAAAEAGRAMPLDELE
jgi:hypothetical protein